MTLGRALIGVTLSFLALDVAAGCLTPQWSPQNIGTGAVLRAGDTAVGDFDGDGLPDIAALAQTSIGQPWTRVIVSRLGATASTVHTGASLVGRIFAADVTGDNRPDLIVADMSAKSIVVLSGRTNGTFNAPITTTLTVTPVALTVADLTGDKKADVVLYESTTQSVLVMKGDGTGRFSKVEQLSLPISAYSMTAGDFNGDGKLDVAVGHFQFAGVTLLFGIGDGTFGGAIPLDAGNWPAGIAAGDLDGDTRIDLVTADYVDGKISIFLNDRNLGFKPAVRYNTATNPSAVALADFSGDKKLDIAVATLNGDRAMSFTNNGNGTFRAGVTAACPNCNLIGITAADLNADTRPDLVTGSSSLIAYMNDCGSSRVTLTPRKATINALEDASFDVKVNGVVDGAPAPTGTITLREGSTSLASASAGSIAPIVIKSLAAGAHTITARYSGDSEYDPNTSAAVEQTVNALATTLVLSRTPETSVSGQAVTINALVTSGNLQPAGGTTTITINGATAKTFTGGSGSVVVTPTVGSLRVAAQYSGDAAYAASTSNTLVHEVGKATPAVTAAPLNAAGVGQAAIFAVTVAPPFAGTPSGVVRLVEGGTIHAAAVLDENGTARLHTSALTVGTHQLQVFYEGSAEFNGAESTPFSFTVSSEQVPQKRRAARH